MAGVSKPDASGTFHLVREDRSATPNLVLPPGGYVVHAALGLVQGLFFVVDGTVQLLDGPGQLLGNEYAARRALLTDDVEQAVGMLGQHDHFPGRV